MFSDFISDASVVDWILLCGLVLGLMLRGLEWYWKQDRLASESKSYVTRDEMHHQLEIRKLQHDADLKHWVRNEFLQYAPVQQIVDLTRRIERVEDKE